MHLNRHVQRFKADPDAVREINRHYQTSGNLTNPMVTLHTLLDPIVPYWHEPLYLFKVYGNGDGSLLVSLPSPHYGHCNFAVEELLAAFAILVLKVAGQDLLAYESALPNESRRAEFLRLAQKHGAMKSVVR